MASNPFRTGIFVLSGLILLVVTLFLLGLSDIFVQKSKFVTLVQESVQGLDVGSSVRYRGVPVGNVTAIRIQTHDKLIRIEMEIREQPFISIQSYFGSQKDARSQFREFFEKELGNGLRLRLNYAGITGLKYVELDHFDTQTDKNVIPRPQELPSDVFYIPSQPSVFTDMLKTISVALDKVSKVPFDQISDKLQESIDRFNRTINDPGIIATIENVEGISRAINQSTNIFVKHWDEKTVVKFKEQTMRMLNDTSDLIAMLKDAAVQMDLSDTADEIRRTTQNAESAIAKLERTLDALSLLLDYLNRDPAALIRGKKAGAVDPGKLQ